MNTNGIKLAADPEYAKRLKEAGLDLIYLQFDGWTRTSTGISAAVRCWI